MGLEKRMAFRIDEDKADKLSELCSSLGMSESAFIRILINRTLSIIEMAEEEERKGKARSIKELISRMDGNFEGWVLGWERDFGVEGNPEFYEALAHKYLEIAELWRKKNAT